MKLESFLSVSRLFRRRIAHFAWNRKHCHEVILAAAATVVCHLRERVTLADIPDPPREVPDIWLRQITDETGFQIIYVAALRSVGIPARLNGRGQAEFFDGNRWISAPAPAVASF